MRLSANMNTAMNLRHKDPEPMRREHPSTERGQGFRRQREETKETVQRRKTRNERGRGAMGPGYAMPCW